MWSLKNSVSGQVPASAVSTALVICSGAWLYSAFAGYRASGLGQNWSLTPLFCLLALTLTPAICCSLAVIIIDSRKRWSLSCLDRSALVAAILPVTLGTFLAVGAIKALVFAHP